MLEKYDTDGNQQLDWDEFKRLAVELTIAYTHTSERAASLLAFFRKESRSVRHGLSLFPRRSDSEGLFLPRETMLRSLGAGGLAGPDATAGADALGFESINIARVRARPGYEIVHFYKEPPESFFFVVEENTRGIETRHRRRTRRPRENSGVLWRNDGACSR